MRPIEFESRLIELSNGSRITSIGVRTKPGRAREVGSIICLNKRSLDRSEDVWIDPKWSGSQQKVLDRSEQFWIDPKWFKTPSDCFGSIQLMFGSIQTGFEWNFDSLFKMNGASIQGKNWGSKAQIIKREGHINNQFMDWSTKHTKPKLNQLQTQLPWWQTSVMKILGAITRVMH